MFQKVGLLDIFLGLWKRKYKIIAIGIAAVVLAVAVSAANVMNFTPSKSDDTYYKSATFYVESTEKTEGVDWVNQSQKIRLAYKTFFESELFADYLQKTVGADLEKPLGDYLVPIKGNEEILLSIPDDNIQKIYTSYKVEASADASTVKVSFNCFDSDIGEKLLDASYSFAVEEISGKISPSSFKEIGRNSYSVYGSEAKNLSFSSLIKLMIKKSVVYGVVFEFIYLLIAAFIMIFKPVVNRENDIREYGINCPIWSSENKKNKQDVNLVYAARYVINNAKDKIVGIISADNVSDDVKNRSVVNFYNTFVKLGKKVALVNFDPNFKEEIDFVNAELNKDDVQYGFEKAFSSVETEKFDIILVNMCSASEHGYLLDSNIPVKQTVMTLKLGKTQYSRFEKAIDMLGQNSVNVIGFVLGK